MTTSKVADTIAMAEKRRSSGTGSDASPPLRSSLGSTNGRREPSAAVPGKTLTAQTQRGGEFAPSTVDPSGTKGAEIKYPPGSVRTF